MPDYGAWRGAERATGRVAATGMQIMQYNAQRQDAASRLLVEQDRLKLAQEQGQRQETLFQNAEKKRMEQEKQDNAWTPASFISKNINGMPETKKGFLSILDEGGYKYKVVGDEVYVQNKGYKHLAERLNTDSAIKKTVLGSMLTDLQTQSAGIGQQLASGEIKKPDDLKAAEDKQAGIKKQIAGIIGAQEETIRKQMTTPPPKIPNVTGVDAQGNPVRTPDVPGAAVYQKPVAPPKEESFDKNIFLAAQAVGVDPEKVKSGKLSQPEAIKVADEYQKRHGTESLIRLLFGGALPGMAAPGQAPAAPELSFDEKGNLK